MKKFGILFFFAFFGTLAFAQNGNGLAHVTAVNVSSTSGSMETVDIRYSGQHANEMPSLTFEIPGMREMVPQMTKVSGSNGNGNNGTSLWSVSIDLDQYADSNGDVSVILTSGCCNIPHGGIIVKTKPH